MYISIYHILSNIVYVFYILDPKESQEPAGSLLINTRTGEGNLTFTMSSVIMGTNFAIIYMNIKQIRTIDLGEDLRCSKQLSP